MYLLVIFLCLLISSFILFFGRFIGRYGTNILVISGLFLCLFLSFILFFEIALSNSNCLIFLYKWIDLGYFIFNISFYFDTITVIMLMIVCFISFLVHIYSIEYMKNDPAYIRYMAFLSLFTFFMLLLVSSDNFLQMFVGWEGVGLSSYLLISFWYTRFLANKAAIKAMLINRIGDLFLLIAICMICFYFNSLKYNIVFPLIPYFINYKIFFFFNYQIIDIISFFLFLGAMGKSAQIGLHIWLPDAMEGPTPVSALIHAATMVTAGVFLIIRCSFIFEYSHNILIFIGLIGSMTSLFSSIIGCFQFDIKKIVAYSTCSQLGYMFFSCSLSNYNVSLFHLFNHAFFKALLFLSMGSIIHALSDEQDFRRMGGLVNLLPFTYIMVIIGSFSLMALPFLSGFYSKDMILEFTYARFNLDSFFFFLIGNIAAFFTAFYSMRLIYWVFLAPVNFYRSNLFYIHEPKFFMIFPMFVLSIFSIFIGYIFFESFIGIGSSFWSNSIYINIYNYFIFDAEFNLFFVKYVPLLVSLLGILIMYISIYNYEKIFFLFFSNSIFIKLYIFFSRSFFFDYFFIDFLFKNMIYISYKYFYKYLEKGFFEIFIKIFIYKFIKYIFKKFIFFDDGLIYNYIFLILFFIIFIFFFYIYIFFYNINIYLLLFFGIINNYYGKNK